MTPREIFPEDYLTPEMAKLARALRFVDDRPVKAFNHRELTAIRTAGMRVHYEALGRGLHVIGRKYRLDQASVRYHLFKAGVQMRPKLRNYGKLRIFRMGIEQAMQAAEEAA